MWFVAMFQATSANNTSCCKPCCNTPAAKNIPGGVFKGGLGSIYPCALLNTSVKGVLSALSFGVCLNCASLCCRYCLEMRLQPACADDTVAFVQQQCPAARLLNRTVDRLSFSIPQEVNYLHHSSDLCFNLHILQRLIRFVRTNGISLFTAACAAFHV